MDLTDKKILVTGASGFLGHHVMKALLDGGVPQKNISAPRSTELDLLLADDCEKAVAQMDVVIHLAGLTGDGKFHEAHPGEIFYGNMIMGAQLMDAARRAGVQKFMVAGSAVEYPATAHSPFQEKELLDGAPEKSHMPYGIAKRALLAQGQAYRDQYQFNAIHLLLTNMYGPFAKPDSSAVSTFVEKISRAKKDGEPNVTFGGTGEATRDFLYAGDAAEAILLAMRSYEGREPINIGSGKETSIIELAQTVGKLANFSGSVVFDPSKSSDKTKRVLDVSRAEKEMGFRAKTSLEAGLQKTIEWYNTQT